MLKVSGGHIGGVLCTQGCFFAVGEKDQVLTVLISEQDCIVKLTTDTPLNAARSQASLIKDEEDI
jgi:hypothetical protein